MTKAEAKELIYDFRTRIYGDISRDTARIIDTYLNGNNRIIKFDDDEENNSNVCPYCGSKAIREFSGDIYKYECRNCMELFNN